MYYRTLLLLILLSASVSVLAENTGRGKVVSTQGHSNPSCRKVGFQALGSTFTEYYGIADVAGDDDVNAVLLSAMIANREVVIYYDYDTTTGCGWEPQITYVTVY